VLLSFLHLPKIWTKLENAESSETEERHQRIPVQKAVLFKEKLASSYSSQTE